MFPAILFEPDGYVVSGDRIMGRQAAGGAFLRAAIRAASPDDGLWAYTARANSAEVFEAVVQQESEGAIPAHWCRSGDLGQLATLGGLYLPGPDLAEQANLRLRAGVATYSITGITHTTASARAMDALAAMLTAPVMPWDALICTSTAVVETVRIVLSEQAALLRWRFGKDLDFTLPLTPMIPLGVHPDEFTFDADQRAAARKELGLDDDAVVLLFAGRLSFHAKAHPHAMYLAAERVAQETGRKLVLIQNGWFANQAIEDAFKNAAATYAPNVTCLFTDGRKGAEKARSWAASDIFVSLSDNIQETFGLTPVEAMAAGLPILATDWNGYKDTVRDGIEGFRVPTHAPASGFGRDLALRFEAGVDNYDYYCGLTCQLVSIDHDLLAQRMKQLVDDPALRLKMGKAGQQRVAEVYDWKVVFAQYFALWEQQAQMRAEVTKSPAWQDRLAAAPRQAPGRLDPFMAFGHYPTVPVTGQTLLQTVASSSSLATFQQLVADPLFTYARAIMPSPGMVESILGALAGGAMTIDELADKTRLPVFAITQAAAVLAKMGILRPLPNGALPLA